jgi:hypothetical protein
MSTAKMGAPVKFMNTLADLYSNVSDWVVPRYLQVVRSSMNLNEEAYGKYEVEKLSIIDANAKRVCELLPVGGSVIGAEGRVDLIGDVDQEILVYLTNDGLLERRSTSLYRGVEEDGWYWIEIRRLSRVRRLDEALFLDLLAEVSEHACC